MFCLLLKFIAKSENFHMRIEPASFCLGQSVKPGNKLN